MCLTTASLVLEGDALDGGVTEYPLGDLKEGQSELQKFWILKESRGKKTIIRLVAHV